MASINQVILIGHLGQDPVVRGLPSGKAVVNVTLATHERWRDRATGEQQERTEWHRLVFYSPLADIVGQYLRQGSLVYVAGRLQTRQWQDANGQDRFTTEIVVHDLKMLGGRGSPSASTAGTPERVEVGIAPAPAPATRPTATRILQPAPVLEPAGGGEGDDIPFAPYQRGAEYAV